MGDDKQKKTEQTTGSMPRGSSQVGTHGQTGSMQDPYGSGSNQGSQGNWNGPAERDMAQGDQTMPAQPSGTSPLDKDQQPVNQNRGQQNRG